MCELRKLPVSLAKKAATELNETSENIAQKLPALRKWIESQTHLRSRTDDQFLIVFLRGAKYDLEKAKKKLHNYYTYKLKMPELYYGRNLSDPKVYMILKLGCLTYLPEPAAPDGPRVVMIRLNRFDLTKHTVIDVFKVGSMVTDILIGKDDNAIISGYVMVLDLRNVSKSVLCSFNLSFVRKLILLANKVSPTRMKGFHCLHAPAIFAKLFNLVKHVINQKLRDRIHMHEGNLETLYKYVPKHILIKEYGGDIDDSEWPEFWWRKLKENSQFLKEEETYGVIGKIEHLGKYLDNNEFGVEGNFRHLSID